MTPLPHAGPDGTMQKSGMVFTMPFFIFLL